jgi:Immunity protein 52
LRHRSAVPRAITMPPVADELRIWLEENPSIESREGRKQLAGYYLIAGRPDDLLPHANFWLNPRCTLRHDWFGNQIGTTFFTDRDTDSVDHLSALVRDALLITASVWDCEWAAVAPGNFADMSLPQRKVVRYQGGWMVYLDDGLASRLHEREDVTIENLREGGILLVAVTNVIFDRRNALHIAAARRLQAALAPLNAEDDKDD